MNIPALWLITFIVGLPQFSETVYTPALPDIVSSLSTTPEMGELTLTIYLFGFAVGTFFWGFISDIAGRKPCLLLGLCLYVMGCIGCFYSYSIDILLLSRFVQAFGGSTGSVLGQAICRDSFEGKKLGEVYATVGSALALSPAVGPILGGFTDQFMGWSSIFLILCFLGCFTFFAVLKKLPETGRRSTPNLSQLAILAKNMLSDRSLLSCGLIIGACNGILFSYYAEGSFYLINLHHLTPSLYGLSYILLSLAGVAAGIFTKKMYTYKSKSEVAQIGATIVFIGTICFSTLSFFFSSMGNIFAIFSTIFSMMVIQFGSGVTLAVILAKSLENYRHAIGIASSLFGLFYYIVISLLTFILGMIHSDNVLTMPLFFTCIAFCIKWLTSKVMKLEGGVLSST